MKSISYVEDLNYTKELLQEDKFRFLHSVIGIVYIIFIFSICWLIFGKHEEVVKAKGLIRPEKNISFVKSI